MVDLAYQRTSLDELKEKHESDLALQRTQLWEEYEEKQELQKQAGAREASLARETQQSNVEKLRQQVAKESVTLASHHDTLREKYASAEKQRQEDYLTKLGQVGEEHKHDLFLERQRTRELEDVIAAERGRFAKLADGFTAEKLAVERFLLEARNLTNDTNLAEDKPQTVVENTSLAQRLTTALAQVNARLKHLQDQVTLSHP